MTKLALLTTTAFGFSYDRLSHLSQLDGNGRKRQRDQRDAWLAANPHVTLVQSMEDIGFSGWRGLHRKKGTFGGFEALVDEGKIPPGSYLILDALDRMTREDLDDALHLLLKFIRRGINVVTTNDGMVYTKRMGREQLLVSLMMAMMHLSLGAQESDLKSQRHLSNWDGKRKRAAANGERLTARRRGWLLPREPGDNEAVEHIPHNNLWKAQYPHTSTIIKMFELCANGRGAAQIINFFDDLEIACPTEGSQSRNTGKWSGTSVRRILTSRAVLGELEMTAYAADGKSRTVVGILPHYYPRIIEDDLWMQAQAAILRRTDGSAIRESKHIMLVTGIARCTACGGPMGRQAAAQGRPARLQCRARSRAVSLCRTGPNFQLPRFEARLRKILWLMLSTNHVVDDNTGLDDRIAVNTAEIERQQTDLDALMDAFGSGSGDDDRRAIERRKERLATLRAEAKTLSTEQIRHRGESAPDDAAATIEALWVKSEAGDEDARIELKKMIRQVVSRIDCNPDKSVEYHLHNGLRAGVRVGDLVITERSPREPDNWFSIHTCPDKPIPAQQMGLTTLRTDVAGS